MMLQLSIPIFFGICTKSWFCKWNESSQKGCANEKTSAESEETPELKCLNTNAEVVLLIHKACCLHVFFIAFANKTDQER